jgi:predicted nicotinamide N-methyase
MTRSPSRDWPAFIREHTQLLSPPLVPEIKLHLAAESLPIWQSTEEALAERNVPPPYWAFAWAGGQALARYLLDRPDRVRGKRVLDLGAGSGLTAIAARIAGAADVLANDIDALAQAAMALNADANGVTLRLSTDDLLAADDPAPHLISVDVLLIGDLFYEKPLAERVLAFADRAAGRGILALTGDPQRSYFPIQRFVALEAYSVPVTRELEDSDIKRTTVWALTAAPPPVRA